MIYILTGPIRTGKTSALLKWCKNRNDVDGILCPDNENGNRYFLNIKTEEAYILECEAETESDKIVSIGPYLFLKKAFDKAIEYLNSVLNKKNHSFVIIDELGKLELKDQGLHLAAKTLITEFIKNESSHLILVVRESLLDAVVGRYNISSYKILVKEDLDNLK